jgi:mRNA interferase MazF
MRRGEVWVANLNPDRGAETGKIRPVVILQDDSLLESALGTVMVSPMTTQVRRGVAPLRVPVAARDRLRKDCQVMVDKTRALDRNRFVEGPLTRLTDRELQAVEHSLRALLGLG